jgi:phage tail protein X
MNRTRLDAESIRDSVLLAAGKLDLTMGGPAVRQFGFKDDHSPVYDYAAFDPDAPGGYRRSIYRFLVRSAPDPFMERLDCPDPSLLTPKRSTTLTAIQALAMWNNRFMVRMAEHLAARVAGDGDRLGRLVLGRRLATAEASYGARHGLANLARVLLNTNEFLFVD